MYMYVDIVPGLPMFCLTDFVQRLSYKGVQDRQVSVVIFFIYIYIYIFFFCFAVGMGNLKCCNKNNNNNNK